MQVERFNTGEAYEWTGVMTKDFLLNVAPDKYSISPNGTLQMTIDDVPVLMKPGQWIVLFEGIFGVFTKEQFASNWTPTDNTELLREKRNRALGLLSNVIENIWGSRCSMNEAGCACCGVWAVFDAMERLTDVG